MDRRAADSAKRWVRAHCTADRWPARGRGPYGRGAVARSGLPGPLHPPAARVWRVPPYGADPLCWLDAALGVYRAAGMDVLMPTQEQVAVLAAGEEMVRAAGVCTAVLSFAALSRVQDKISAFARLTAAGLPQPEGAIPATPAVVAAWDRFPHVHESASWDRHHRRAQDLRSCAARRGSVRRDGGRRVRRRGCPGPADRPAVAGDRRARGCRPPRRRLPRQCRGAGPGTA